MNRGQILLGREIATGRPVYISPRDRSTHMQIIGSTGEGKSKFMEHLLREDIINNNGLCLIDPHGYLYNDIVTWCETKRFLGRKKIILFDPSEEDWTFGFNPLKVSSRDLAFHVDGMVKACAKVWGGENTDRTPLLKRCLRIVFHALAEKQLSLAEALHLIDPNEQELRRYLTYNIGDPVIRKQWAYFNGLSPRNFSEEFSSTVNRMMEFLSSPIIRAIIGQIRETIDFRQIMDEGYTLLVNLAPTNRLSDDNARLLGSLIVNDLFMNCRGRPKDSKPFYLYIDECGLFINEDIRRILDEGRKFGLHLILAHQTLGQLRKAGEDIYDSVMGDAKTKVIFGGLSAENARIIAEQIFLGELDFEEAKTTLNKPVVVAYIKTWLQNHTEGRSSSQGQSQGTSRGSGTTTVMSEGEAVTPSQQFLGDDHVVMTTNTSIGSTSSYTESEGSFASESESESRGESEAFVPELEDRPSQVFSIEEQIYKAMALMVNQATQHAIIKLPKQHTIMVKTPTIKDGYARAERVRKFKEESYRLTDFAKSKQLIEQEITERWTLLEHKAQEPINATPDPETFRE